MAILFVNREDSNGFINPDAAPDDLRAAALYLRSYTLPVIPDSEAGAFGRFLKAIVRNLSNWCNGTAWFKLGDGGQKVLKCRDGILQGRRVEFFKAGKAAAALQSDQFGKFLKRKQLKASLPANDKDALATVRLLMENNYYFRAEVAKSSDSGKSQKVSGMKVLQICQKQVYENEDNLMVWQYDPPHVRTLSTIRSVLAICVILALVMFPLWPMQLRTGVWYVSMSGVGFVGGLLVLGVIRMILYVLSLPFSRGFWLFPNLFADVGVVDSFIPLYGWSGIDYEKMHLEKYKRQSKKGSGKKRSSKKEKLKGALPSSGTPLLEQVTDGDSVARKESTDEDVEEIIMD